MKIGDFARECGVKISVLQFYDKAGVLRPVYIDRFTGYRYYDRSQVAVYERISQLKSVGFSLAEIRRMLYADTGTEELFEKRKRELERQLEKLGQLRTMMSGGIIVEQTYQPLAEDIDLPFENDEQVIGKWQLVREEDGSDVPSSALGGKERCLYFLPEGESYWCYSWTKGRLLVDTGTERYANGYRTEKRGGDLYMVVDLKSYDYRRTGETVPVALRKIDSRRYTREEIARKDDVNKPFREDKRVIGRWRSCGFLSAADKKDGRYDLAGMAEKPQGSGLYFREITFSEGGHCTSLYGDERISGDEMQTWTKGYVLRKWNSTACAYEIKSIDGREYMIMEWKSGDYRWGGFDSDYYVFVKEQTF